MTELLASQLLAAACAAATFELNATTISLSPATSRRLTGRRRRWNMLSLSKAGRPLMVTLAIVSRPRLTSCTCCFARSVASAANEREYVQFVSATQRCASWFEALNGSPMRPAASKSVWI